MASNGAGKSTLLRALSGDGVSASQGEVQLRKGARLAYLAQEPKLRADLPVVDAVLASDASPALRLVARFAAADAAGDAAALATLSPQMDAASAWSLDSDLRTCLDKLGCASFLHRTVGELSGGQAKRVALATVLLSTPDVLLLDEPTNHLCAPLSPPPSFSLRSDARWRSSVEAVEWLAQRLIQSDSTLLFVSHDRAFMEEVCTDILELDGFGGSFRHGCGYSAFQAARALRLQTAANAAANAEKLLTKEAVWMSRQPQGRQAKAQARQDRFHTLVDKASATPSVMGTLEVSSGDVRASRLGTEIVSLRDVSLRLGGETQILKNFSHTFAKGERVGVVGKNGVGKSTFMNVLTGKQPVDSGSVSIGETVVFGFYEQQYVFKHPTQRVADFVAQLAADARERDEKGRDWNGWSPRELLERFQFLKGRQGTAICDLSGGERRRLQLMECLVGREGGAPNFLLFDELSNDLDLQTIEAVEGMLEGWTGVTIMTGHDRALLDTADHLFVFEGDGRVSDFKGSYSQLRAIQRAEESEKSGGSAKPQMQQPPAPGAAEADREARRLASNASKKVPKVEADIVKTEAEIARIDEALALAGADAGKAVALAAERSTAAERLDALFEEYERLDVLCRAGGTTK